MIRTFLFNILGSKNVDRLRYWKFSFRLSKALKEIEEDKKYSISEQARSYLIAKRFSEFYEPEMEAIPEILDNPEVILDIGSNYGHYSAFLSKLYPNSKIYAFEPVERTFNILKKVKEKFSLENVELIKKGLGSQEGDKIIVLPNHYTITAYIKDFYQEFNKNDDIEIVKITTLDNFVKEKKISRLDFIKCDVEGFELEIFEGGKKAIKRFKPIIFVEIEERHTKKYDINPQEVIDFLIELDYSCYSVKGDHITKTNIVDKNIPLYIFKKK